MGSHQDFNELTHGITFRIQWGWQQRSVLAIKGKTPGSKPRTFLWWAFFASCVLEVYERQSPGDSSELPGYLDTSLPAGNTNYDLLLPIYAPPSHLSFQPPSTVGFRS